MSESRAAKVFGLGLGAVFALIMAMHALSTTAAPDIGASPAVTESAAN